MRRCGMFDQGRFVRVVLLGLLVSFGAGWLPNIALAEQGYPDFYGTIIAVDRDRAMVTLATDSDETVVIDVRDLGMRPFDEGAFKLDNVVLLRTRREPGAFVAIGWEQARDGREKFRN